MAALIWCESVLWYQVRSPNSLLMDTLATTSQEGVMIRILDQGAPPQHSHAMQLLSNDMRK